MSWSPEQRRNANIIISVGRNMGMSWRDVQIGLMTALQESGLRNVNYGDRDSLGLFQQRPSQGWGSASQVTDPQYAAHKFFSVLKGVKGRDSMALTRAAQAVQRSAFPDAYAKHTSEALGFVMDARKSGIKMTGGSPITGPGSPEQISGADLGMSTGGFAGFSGGETQSQPIDPLVAAGTSTANSALSATTDSMGGMAPGLGASTAGAAYPSATPAATPVADMPTFNSPQDYQAAFGGSTIPYQKGVDNTSSSIVQFAKKFIGVPYVWGGTDLNSGVDCSGFVQAVYKHFGVNLPRVSYQQANSGTRIGLKQLRPGDLVAFDNSARNNGADHISIYAGNGMILEAPRPGVGVRLRKLGSNEGAWGVRLHKN